MNEMHNPIADMYGPAFLLLYAVVIFVTIVAARWLALRTDTSSQLPKLEVPREPDAYEIAYLRGGEVEVAHVAIVNLLQRGCLRVSGQHIEANPSQEIRSQTPLESAIIAHFSKPRSAAQTFNRATLKRLAHTYCASIAGRLENERLLLTSDDRTRRLMPALAGVALIVGLGGFKLVAALDKGKHNVGFLCIMAFVGVIFTLVFALKGRLTVRGRDYLARLRGAFAGLRSRSISGTVQSDASSGQPAIDPSLLLLTGLFGVGALAATPLDPYYAMHRKVAGAASAGGCGTGYFSSCGGASSCSGGSSCGGGGCGGGGCGGCGG